MNAPGMIIVDCGERRWSLSRSDIDGISLAGDWAFGHELRCKVSFAADADDRPDRFVDAGLVDGAGLLAVAGASSERHAIEASLPAPATKATPGPGLPAQRPSSVFRRV